MNDNLKDELLRMVVVTYSRYCDIGAYQGKHFVKLEGYVSNELLQFLNSLPPIERDPPIEIDMRSRYVVYVINYDSIHNMVKGDDNE